MQTMVFTGRLAADPQISDDFGKAVFRLLEQRGTDNAGKARLVGVNCVSWSKGLNEKVIARGLAQGCEAVVIGAFIDTAYTARDGSERTAIRFVTLLEESEQAEGATFERTTLIRRQFADGFQRRRKKLGRYLGAHGSIREARHAVPLNGCGSPVWA